MTPEQIKTWTITMPRGKIVPRSGTEWYVEVGGSSEGPFPSRAAAVDAYVAKYNDDGEMCLNCGS